LRLTEASGWFASSAFAGAAFFAGFFAEAGFFAGAAFFAGFFAEAGFFAGFFAATAFFAGAAFFAGFFAITLGAALLFVDLVFFLGGISLGTLSAASPRRNEDAHHATRSTRYAISRACAERAVGRVV
jgi:hypothetical protein